MKSCSKCKEIKPISEFNKTGTYCKICVRSYTKHHYQNNKEQYQVNHLNYYKWFIDYKASLKCEKCGFSHPAALDFHHIDPKTKKFSVSLSNAVNKDRDEVEEEIKKCIILCSNCHRIEHSIRYNKYLNTDVSPQAYTL